MGNLKIPYFFTFFEKITEISYLLKNILYKMKIRGVFYQKNILFINSDLYNFKNRSKNYSKIVKLLSYVLVNL